MRNVTLLTSHVIPNLYATFLFLQNTEGNISKIVTNHSSHWLPFNGHLSKYLLLCYTEKTVKYRFWTTQKIINDQMLVELKWMWLLHICSNTEETKFCLIPTVIKKDNNNYYFDDFLLLLSTRLDQPDMTQIWIKILLWPHECIYSVLFILYSTYFTVCQCAPLGDTIHLSQCWNQITWAICIPPPS